MSSDTTRLRPTTNKVIEAIFSMLGLDGVAGLNVLELYSGGGAFGRLALERGAKRVDFVEIDRHRCTMLKHKLVKFDQTGWRVRHGDALRVIAKLEHIYDIVFADPPYSFTPFELVATKLSNAGVLAPSATVFFEHSAKHSPSELLDGLVKVKSKRYGDSGVSVFHPLRKE